MASPASNAFLQIIQSTGPASGATAEYYESGSTTPAAVYSDEDLSTSLGAVLSGGNAADSQGRFPIHFLDPAVSYKRIIKSSAGSTIRTDDPVQTASSSASSIPTISTIAMLQAETWATVARPDAVYVISNTTAGDGGGLFRYDSSDTSSVDNATTVIVDATGNRWKRQPYRANGQAIEEAKGTAIASAATLNLDNATGNFLHITGTTTVTAVTLSAGRKRRCIADGAFKLTNGVSLIVQGGADYTCAVGDTLDFRGDGGGVVYVSILPIDGEAIIDNQIDSVTGKLKVEVTSASQVTVTARAISLVNSSGYIKRFTNVSEVAALSSSGAGGLDTGSEASNTWYYVWLIGKADGTIDALLSASSTAPTLPSGYTFSRYCGAVRNDSGSDLYRTIQYGNRCYHRIGTNPTVGVIIASGSSGSATVPTWTAVDISSFVPTAVAGHGIFAIVGLGNIQSGLAPNDSHGAYNSTTNPPWVQASNNSSAVTEMPLESTSVYWYANGGTYIYVRGWVDGNV